jgi:hypothetical protein
MCKLGGLFGMHELDIFGEKSINFLAFIYFIYNLLQGSAFRAVDFWQKLIVGIYSKQKRGR